MVLYLEIAGGALLLLLVCLVPWLIIRLGRKRRLRRGMLSDVEKLLSDEEKVEAYELKARFERLAREHDARAKQLGLQVKALRDQLSKLNKAHLEEETKMGGTIKQLKEEKHALELLVADLKKQLSYYK